jgi:hypothetical protein
MIPSITRPDSSVVEIPPTHCPNGHRIGAGRVLVGWDPITRERTYTCRECWITISYPSESQR